MFMFQGSGLFEVREYKVHPRCSLTFGFGCSIGVLSIMLKPPIMP